VTLKQFLALIGFFFVFTWIAFGFGDAILCLVGAGVFYGVAALLQGEVDLSDVQARVRAAQNPPGVR
jgi:heme exporter protein D